MVFQSYYNFYEKFPAFEMIIAYEVELNGTFFDEIVFIPLYCSDKNCDCRRVIVQVYERDPKKRHLPLAVITYGWENYSFYRKWSKNLSDEEIRESLGPALEPRHKQSHPDPYIVDVFHQALEMPSIKQRFRRQYAQFKLAIGMKLPKDVASHLGLMQPCVCESGKIFKFCCAPKNRL